MCVDICIKFLIVFLGLFRELLQSIPTKIELIGKHSYCFSFVFLLLVCTSYISVSFM